MMTNLFSIFDPSTSSSLSFNWASIYLWVCLIPLSYWVCPTRVAMVMTKLTSYIYSEFSPLIKKSPQTLLVTLSVFLFIMFNNVPGLLPYIFTASSHMSLTLMMALPFWLGTMLHGCAFNTSNLLIHLIPNGTPVVLMPFMVVIETISNIIRPLTLAIRLAANMIAGHLLITLLTSATPLTPFMFLPALAFGQTALASLEVAVAMIQAYVFSVLLTLYTSETIA